MEAIAFMTNSLSFSLGIPPAKISTALKKNRTVISLWRNVGKEYIWK
jgi:hypothetical protein